MHRYGCVRTVVHSLVCASAVRASLFVFSLHHHATDILGKELCEADGRERGRSRAREKVATVCRDGDSMTEEIGSRGTT